MSGLCKDGRERDGMRVSKIQTISAQKKDSVFFFIQYAYKKTPRRCLFVR